VPCFPDLDALNVWLEERCIALWSQIVHGGLSGTVADIWAQEVTSLMPLGRPFDGFVEHSKRVSPTCLVYGACRERPNVACQTIPGSTTEPERMEGSDGLNPGRKSPECWRDRRSPPYLMGQ
jgi:hypothetical protein